MIDEHELARKTTVSNKLFCIHKGVIRKNVYDFITQYPSGQIQLFDKQTMKPQFVEPIHTGVSVILLMTEETLKENELEGYTLMDKVGLVYRG